MDEGFKKPAQESTIISKEAVKNIQQELSLDHYHDFVSYLAVWNW